MPAGSDQGDEATLQDYEPPNRAAEGRDHDHGPFPGVSVRSIDAFCPGLLAQ